MVAMKPSSKRLGHYNVNWLFFHAKRDRKAGYTKSMEKIKIEQHSAAGGLWFVGWLFAIGYLKLGFWKGVLALLLWPYFLGAHFSPLV